jgi:hypothetical protein
MNGWDGMGMGFCHVCELTHHYLFVSWIGILEFQFETVEFGVCLVSTGTGGM